MADQVDIRLTRTHKIYSDRIEQLQLNKLAVSGGKPYIDQRLSRLPFESDVSWSGSAWVSQKLGSGKLPTGGAAHGGDGRNSRAFLINYAARICAKINQYVFSTPVKREGVDETFEADSTRTGMSINDLMRQVSTAVTSCRWCWLGIDRDPPPDGTGLRSVAEKEASGDRVYWTFWHPSEVVDWHFDRLGGLDRVITEQSVYENTDVNTAPVIQTLRTIWIPGGGVRIWMNPEKRDKIVREEEFSISAPIVPFVLAGLPSADAWWFDDVEARQASLLNLQSVHNESLFQSVYPQLVLPAELLQTITEALKITGDQALELIRGLNYPILEPSAAAGLTRYIMPAVDGMKLIPDEITRGCRELFDIVGLAMQNPDTRQVASAEAKAWDHLDPEAVLRERALLLEETEKKAVAISRAIDSTFADYSPEYGKKFDVSDIAADMQAVVGLGNLELPLSGRKEIMRAAVEIIDKITGIPDDRKQVILDEIDAMEEAPAPDFVPPTPPAQVENPAMGMK